MIHGKDIVCVSSLDWDAMWTSKQQIMWRLAKKNRVLYVEEPVTMLAPLKVPARWRRWRAILPCLNEVGAGLWRLTPPPMLPFGNMKPSVNRVNQAILARYVRWAMNKLSFGREYIFWTYLPTSFRLLGSLGDWVPACVVYHCVDEHSAFPGLVSPEVVKGYDDALTRYADLVVTTSESLRVARRALNPHTYTVFNGADVEVFGRASDPTLLVPADLAKIPAPRVGVLGMHDSRLDVDALETIASADPSWHVVLIGPVKPGQLDSDRLTSHPNIHFLGQKQRADLPAYVKGLAVALIPYRTSELTRHIFPLKLFEYLAAGVPVVAGGLPELNRFAGTIAIAKSPEEYPELVRSAMTEDNPARRAARAALASENTWEHRVEEISALVEQALVRLGSRHSMNDAEEAVR